MLGGCGKQPEQTAAKQDTAKIEAGQPSADANPENPVIAGQAEAPDTKPVEVQPLDQPPTPPSSDSGPDLEEEIEDGDEDDGVDDREPPPYPEQVGSDPGPFVHPPASAILVVASTRSYSPGETAVDRDAKYHTWIWRPTAGSLPEKGPVLAPVGADGTPSGPALVEEYDGLVVSDGSGLTQLSFEEVSVELTRCECDEFGDGGNWTHSGRPLAKKLFEMRAQPLGPWAAGVAPTAMGDAKVLISASDVRRASTMDCVTERDDVEHVMQVFGVAGSRVLVVERVHDNAACAGQTYELRDEKLFDLAGGSFDLAALERELPYKTVKRARTSSTEELDALGVHSAYDLAPSNLILTAVFPKYREHRGGVRLLLQYSVKADLDGEGEGGWGNGWDSHVVTVAYPESSSLSAPAQAMQLIEYVHREGGSKWKVIGWSQINEASGASGSGDATPSLPAPPTPTPAEAPASE